MKMANGDQADKPRNAVKHAKYNSLKASGQDWFYHAPRTNKTEKSQLAVPVSQIPGIGDLDNSPVDLHDDIHLRRKWIRETDSKYVRLAKEGGRKDLFIYREHKPSTKGAVHYPRVDWFDHAAQSTQEITEDQPDSSRTTYKSAFPEWYVHEENTYKHELDTPSKKKRQIIAFDDMSYWKREAIEEEERRVKSTPVKFPSLARNKHQKFKQGSNGEKDDVIGTKFPDITPKVKQEGNIGQLLSMQYQRDWLDEQNERKQAKHDKKVENFEKEKQKVNKEHKYTKRIQKDKTSPVNEEKNLFKLSRFANVAARTDSHRT